MFIYQRILPGDESKNMPHPSAKLYHVSQMKMVTCKMEQLSKSLESGLMHELKIFGGN